jgi:hypothetical protein
MAETGAYERELEWDDEIQHDGEELVLLPEGEYDFEVVEWTRIRHPGSENMPPCYRVTVKIRIKAPEGTAVFSENLFLHTRTEWKICEFFTSIGHRRRGEPMRMNWNSVTGARGRAEISVDSYEPRNGGARRQTNRVRKFINPAKAAAGQPAQQQQQQPQQQQQQSQQQQQPAQQQQQQPQQGQAPAPPAPGGGWTPGDF